MQTMVMTETAAKALLNDKATCFFAPILPPFAVMHNNNGPVGVYMHTNSDSFVVTKYKTGSKWVNTYRDKEWFEDWRCDVIPAD